MTAILAASSGWARPEKSQPRGSTIRQGRVDSLQALRAVAAVLVMLFHMSSFMPEFMGFEFAGEWFLHGDAGVDIFFVLSGFIIYYSVKGRRSMDRRTFVWARFTRLYPIYWGMILALIVAEWFDLSSGRPERLDPGTILRSVLLLPSPQYVLSVAWTLVLEVMFYAVFAVTFFRSERTFFLTMAVWGAAAMCARLADFNPPPFWLGGYLLYSGVTEFAFGAMIAAICRTPRGVRGGTAALVVGSAAFLAGLADVGPLVGLGREITFGLPSALLVYGAFVVSPRTPRWLVEIGDASYVLYLTHGTLLSISLRLAPSFSVGDLTGSQATGWLAAVAAVALAYALHRRIERPLLAWLRKKTRS